MKKFKASLVIAAAALVFGGLFTSCEWDEYEDHSVEQYIYEKATAGSSSSSSNGGSGSSGSGSGSSGNSGSVATTYTLDITTVPETTGTTAVVDSTVTVVSTKTNSSGTAQTIKYSSNGYVQMSGAGVSTEYALKLTLTGAATIKVKATKKSATGTATGVKLLDSTGAAAGMTSGINDYDTATASLTEYTIPVSAAGTYYLGADSNGCFLYSLVIVYN